MIFCIFAVNSAEKMKLQKSILILLAAFFFSCDFVKEEKDEQSSNYNKIEKEILKSRQLSQKFQEYWYSGEAEITSYTLLQERYGEIREGTAVAIFVSEDFLPNEQVKPDKISEDNISVLKLNSTKNFTTGIYPYSILNSIFSPLKIQDHPEKVSSSVQEWCGQMFMQLNSKQDFEIVSHSYFENEADQNLTLPKTWLEDEIWNRIRINPEELPIENITMIPSFEYLQMRHKERKPYSVIVNLKQEDSISIYHLKYPDLERELRIFFKSHFPYTIEKWEEKIQNPKDSLDLKTTATKLKRIKSKYWEKNNNKHSSLRDSLGLK